MDDLKNDIEKYLKGELPEAKMHALEKRALDDPFLADALEGGAGVDGRTFAQDMALLEQQLGKRVGQKKVIPLWIWSARIAAGLLVMAVATYVIVSLQPSHKAEQNLAVTLEEKTPAPVGSIDTVSGNVSEGYLSMNDADETPQEAEDKRQAEIARSAVPPAQPQQQAAAKPKPVAPGEVLTEKAEEPIVVEEARREPIVEAEAAQTEKQIISESARLAYSPTVATAPPAGREESTERKKAARFAEPSKTMNSDTRRDDEVAVSSGYYAMNTDSVAPRSGPLAPLHTVSGRVTSDDGAILPGVNVMIKGTSTGTVTDIHGNYQLPINDPRTTLVFSFIGMESKEVPVSNDATVNVALNSDVSQLSEVVVVGYGEAKEDEGKAFPTFDMAEPAGGKRAFKKYLEDKLVYPQAALDNKIEGRVTVQFTVETSGQISNLHVVKGLGYGCDDEVIRLIKEGPQWSPMKRDDEPIKGRVRVRMRFTLPKKK